MSAPEEQKPSTSQPNTNEKTIKRWHSCVRSRGLCQVRMKISRLVEGRRTATVQLLDEHIHTHDIEVSFRIKKPSILLKALNQHCPAPGSTKAGHVCTTAWSDVTSSHHCRPLCIMAPKAQGRCWFIKGASIIAWNFGMILNIADADIGSRAAKAKSNFRNKKLAVCTKQ